MDWWGFITSAKRAVHRALESAKFNPNNRAGDVAAKAVIELLEPSGVNLRKMYDEIGIPPTRVKYVPTYMAVCTIRVKAFVHNKDLEKIGEFTFEKSWMKDPREKFMDAAQRIIYLENIAYPAAYLEMFARRNEAIDAGEHNTWKDATDVSPVEIQEMPENTRAI
jgi:hypothetical protein